MKTKIISARVPVDIAKMFEKSCKQQGLTKSKAMMQIISSPNLPMKKMAKGGELEVPDELMSTLAPVGGAGAGILTYQLVKSYFPKDKFTDEQIDGYAWILAIAAGFGGMFLLDSIGKKKGK